MPRILLTCLSLLVLSQPLSAQHMGEVTGTVIDARTKEPLPAASVVVLEQPSLGAVTNASGVFTLRGVPVGTYNLKATMIGYQGSLLPNVVVSTGRSTKVMFKLDEQAVEVQGVTVQATYFGRDNQVSPVSVNSYDRADVKRQPGSNQDVQRVIQNLPGIASSTDNVNELIVRGGAPHENLTVMEYMEIPSINHYANQFNSAGPINMVNIDLVEDVQFSSGGFPAQYGDKMSSVMDLTIREGDRNAGFATNTGFNMAGVGTLMEGCLAGGRGSWIFSARQSFIEVVDKLVGLSTLSLTAVPKYWDAQTKVVYDLSSTQKLTFNGIFGDSRITIDGDARERDELRAGRVDTSGIEDVQAHNRTYAAGINLRSLWGGSGYSVLSLYTAGNMYSATVRENLMAREYDSRGDVLHTDLMNSREVFTNLSNEDLAALRLDALLRIHPDHDLLFGGQIQTSTRWKDRAQYMGDTVRYWIPALGGWSAPVVSQPGDVGVDLGFGSAGKLCAYASDVWRVTHRLRVTAGVRYDHFTYSGHGQFSPRGSVSFDLFPPTTTLSLAAGRYWQTQPFPYYGDPTNTGINTHLANSVADHVVLGLQHIFDGGIRLSVEAYHKRFTGLAVSEEFVHSADDLFRSDLMLTIGERTSDGIEVFLQKKQVEDYYGTASVSLSRTRDTDVRSPARTDVYPSEYDYPVIANLVAGWMAKGSRTWLNGQPWWIRIPLSILPFSDDMELSVRYRYQTGGPTTPRVFTTAMQRRIGGVAWSAGAWQSSKDVNSERFPDYRRLDVQWISRFPLSGWNINVYLAVQNVLDTRNVFYYSYRTDGTRETVYQYGFFPVGGVEVEF